MVLWPPAQQETGYLLKTTEEILIVTGALPLLSEPDLNTKTGLNAEDLT